MHTERSDECSAFKSINPPHTWHVATNAANSQNSVGIEAGACKIATAAKKGRAPREYDQVISGLAIVVGAFLESASRTASPRPAIRDRISHSILIFAHLK
jgi:hypothetical protein